MNAKILITGPPRSGKSTLIAKLIHHFSKKNFTIYGFLTPEVRERNRRTGFDVEDISTEERGVLARIGKINSKYRLGKYYVSLKSLEKIISNLEVIQFTEGNILIIDEIGKMELFSKKFQDYILRVFNSNIAIVATIGLTLKHPLIDRLFQLPDINLFNLDRNNFQMIFQKILSLL